VERFFCRAEDFDVVRSSDTIAKDDEVKTRKPGGAGGVRSESDGGDVGLLREAKAQELGEGWPPSQRPGYSQVFGT